MQKEFDDDCGSIKKLQTFTSNQIAGLMFLVVNTTRQHLSLGDLKVILSPSESIDLDSVADRRIVEASPSVKKAVVAGYLRVVTKDSNHGRQNAIDMDALRKIVREENDGKAISAIAESLVELKNMLSSMPAPQVVHVSSQVEKVDIVESISEPQAENLIAIHEKVVSRMASNLSTNIEPQKGKSKDASDMKKKLDELEGLL